MFLALIACKHHVNDKAQRISRAGFAGFCIVHALLHMNLRNDPLSSFNTPLSWALILGCAAFGLAYLCAEVMGSGRFKNN